MLGIPDDLASILSCAATIATLGYFVWQDKKPKTRAVIGTAIVFVFVALLLSFRAWRQSEQATATHDRQIAKLQKRIRTIIDGHRRTFEEVHASMFKTDPFEAIEALDRLVDAEQVEQDVVACTEIVDGVPREELRTWIFRVTNSDRNILPGRITSLSSDGWIDLKEITDLKRGDELKLTIGGTAKTVIVRLLPVGHEFKEPYKIVGKFDVLRSRDRAAPYDAVGTLSIKLDEDIPKVKLISVHGGKVAFIWSLGETNGPATLLSAELVPPRG